MKHQLPVGSAELKRFAGAHTRAQAAIDAAHGIDAKLPRGAIQPEPLTLKPLLGSIELIDVAGELNHHGAALIGRHLRPQDLGGHIKVNGQPVGERLVHRFARHMQRETALHRFPTRISQALCADRSNRSAARVLAQPWCLPQP